MGKKQKKAADDRDEDLDALAAQIEGAGSNKEPGKGKKKKKAQKKDDFDEDEILKELEDLTLETLREQKPETSEEELAESPKPEKKKTRKGKKGGFGDEEEDEEAKKTRPQGKKAAGLSDEEELQGGGGKADRKDKKKKGKVLKPESGEEEEEEVEMKTAVQKRAEKKERDRKKKKEDRLKHKELEEEEEQEEQEVVKMKTAAQKRAEKKERDRKKKEEERLKRKKLRDKEPPKKTEATPTPAQRIVEEEPEAAEPMGEEETEGVKKKKKKKGEKEKEEEEKGLSKATVKAMQEALVQIKEEEESVKREEEERLRKMEEMETQRLEQELVDQEKKEKRKQKEKERKERLKKEGKLLTKTQKEARARAEITLRMLEAQGFKVPCKDSSTLPKKKPVYGDKRKRKHMATTAPTEGAPEAPAPVTPEAPPEVPAIVEEVAPQPGGGGKDSSEEENGRTKEELLYHRAKKRIEKRRTENMKNVDLKRLRSPVVCVLGHIASGKTKILDKLRHTNVQDGEAGGITQQIGATNVPLETIIEQTRMVKSFDKDTIKIPGMIIIDTPGHKSFRNLRKRGSSLCDIAILVVDIMHGLEPQTLESINLLKKKKRPFIVALNKVDRLYEWKKSPETDVVATLKKQNKSTMDDFDERTKSIMLEFAQQGLNAALFHENKDPRTFVSMVPTSAHSGDGMGNLIGLLVELTQTMLARRLAHCEELRAKIMEVKAVPGKGTTIDVILINGTLREGETIIVPGVDGPIITQIRGLLLPPPLTELRAKNHYKRHKEVNTSQGMKILGKDLDKTLAGLPLLVAHSDDEIPVLRDELGEKGVHVQASTVSPLEALLDFLRTTRERPSPHHRQ